MTKDEAVAVIEDEAAKRFLPGYRVRVADTSAQPELLVGVYIEYVWPDGHKTQASAAVMNEEIRPDFNKTSEFIRVRVLRAAIDLYGVHIRDALGMKNTVIR